MKIKLQRENVTNDKTDFPFSLQLWNVLDWAFEGVEFLICFKEILDNLALHDHAECQMRVRLNRSRLFLLKI